MAVQRSTHPSADTLKAFGLGKLDDSSSGVVISHLDQCDECRNKVAALSGDDFLQRLRQAHSRSSTPIPAKSLAEIAQAEKPPASQAPIPNLPLELANNPHYEILRELGRGGMGVVYLAHNKLMDRLEVLKVVNKTLLDHPGAVERFLREIRAAARLSHANVVAAYSAVQQGELLAFAMEYIEGQDLASLVKSQGPLPVAIACFYLQQTALGLQHAFEKQMVHRDIKPQNLILARDGKKHIVKVLDFGLAKVIREKTDNTGLTGEGRMLGTPDYIAPEQTLDAAKADIRADIYSLGCTLYFLLSGRPPFSANSLGAILLAHQKQEAKPLNLVREEVSGELAGVVRKMMAKSPAQRYQTPREVVQALASFIKPGATPRSPELSVGPVELKPAVKTAARVDRPAAPATPPDVEESPPKRSIPPVGPWKRGAARKRWPGAAMPQTRKKWLIGGGLGAGVLLLVLLGMWASGALKGKTPDGTIGRQTSSVDLQPSDRPDAPPNAIVEDKTRPNAMEEQWIREVSALPAAEQVEAVAAKLKERNPGFDGKIRRQRIVNGVVMEVRFYADETADISPVRALTGLKVLHITGSNEDHPGILSDLTPLKGMQLTGLHCGITRVSDLSPLKEMKLTQFGCPATPVSDLTPLKDMPLIVLYCNSTPVSDLTPLKGMLLESLHCPATQVSDLSPLKDMKLTLLNCAGTRVSDLSPLKEMKLTVLNCGGTRVSDLTPLKDMKLTRLICRDTQVSDLSPLKDMQLTFLNCAVSRVSDLSPLKEMPLKELYCNFKRERDAEILRSIKTLEKINGKLVMELW